MIVMCQVCGHYGQSRMVGLEAKQCQVRASTQRSTAKWFQKGLHPIKPHRQLERYGRVQKDWVVTRDSKDGRSHFEEQRGVESPDIQPSQLERFSETIEEHEQHPGHLQGCEQELEAVLNGLWDEEQEQGLWSLADRDQEEEGGLFRW